MFLVLNFHQKNMKQIKSLIPSKITTFHVNNTHFMVKNLVQITKWLKILTSIFQKSKHLLTYIRYLPYYFWYTYLIYSNMICRNYREMIWHKYLNNEEIRTYGLVTCGRYLYFAILYSIEKDNTYLNQGFYFENVDALLVLINSNLFEPYTGIQSEHFLVSAER